MKISQTYFALLLGASIATAAAAAGGVPEGNVALPAEAATPQQANVATAADVKVADVKPAAAPVKAGLWSYQLVKRPAEPVVKNKKWVRTPVDGFVLAKLEEKGIKPSPDADRAIFIRRATLDVWGVIPTPEEVKAFVNDRSPDAYDKLADRLLASPKYGERQARRWLDLARYADSSGFQNDVTRPNMWRYRDYVIDAFNNDKPYDQFVKEQLAGDELAPGNKEALIATDFLAGYPDNYNSRDLLQRKYQITTDMTDTTGQVFLAQTVGCARCHDHKFDKVSQKEYFQLQAFFANTSEVNDISAAVGSYEESYKQAQAKYQAATKDIRDQQKALLDPIRDVAYKYHKERYLTDSREAIFKPASEWTAQDRWVNHRLANVTREDDYLTYLRDVGANKDNPGYTEENDKRLQNYKKLTEQLKQYDKLKPESGSDKITAMTELGRADSPPTFRFFGGSQERPEEEVQPGFPAAIANGAKPVIVPAVTALGHEFSSGRRTALANWIASPQNPLTARVYVNRVWAQYFGSGIVKSVSDFGRAGDKPTNPELLDYLADSFVKSGWDVKKLQRQVLVSSVYRESSNAREDAYKADPENKLLAVFPRRRLDAEEIRDSLLLASGRLNDVVGGPSVFPPIPKGLDAGNLWKVSKNEDDWNRRSLYIFTRRSVAYPMLDTFDMASSQQVHSKRDVTTTPLQALTLYNSDLVFAWSQALAGRVIREAGDKDSARLDLLYQILFARNPDAIEKTTFVAFLKSHEKVIASKATDGKLAIALPVSYTPGKQADAKPLVITDPIRESAFVDLVHTIVNSNEFSYKF
ncbi:MAG: hypothetical protein JWQ90_2911 [Hydrocarboniphaga sp.]|uniref:DUF1549 and DUF1553 domain-containing protein n=1 Tax=Hydrocarboniphaga sp. TaxID=2033016 RepID=UPI00262312A9|nr:DUF1549 and DUF1553 domain-containing protein [Hydrocarboniphaga sp.]MDB5970461.1 hypothetical protein [Hydrocarboniphaga sp.]